MTKSAFLSLVGLPNVGKSTLLNALVGAKVAIVSPKPQTTRTRVTGVATEGETQLVYIDTPGLLIPRSALGKYMRKTSFEAATGVDAGVLVVDASRAKEPAPGEKELMAKMRSGGVPCVLALNKTDRVPVKENLLKTIADYTERFPFRAVVPVCALTGEGVDELKQELFAFAREGPHYFPDGVLTDQPDAVLAAELVREQILRIMRDEVPHGTAVVTERWEEDPGKNLLHIDCTVYCEKASHKGMIIGKNGARLKEIGTAARAQIEQMFGCRADLHTWVKVREDWRNRQGLLNRFGYGG